MKKITIMDQSGPYEILDYSSNIYICKNIWKQK